MTDDEDRRLRQAALRNAESILRARQQVEAELVATKEALEQRTAELARLAEALGASEQRFRAAFDSAAVGMVMGTLDGRFEQVNQRFCEIVGYSAEELLRLPYADIVHPDDVASTEEQIRRLLDGAVSHLSLEKRYVHKEGHTVWSTTSVTLVEGSGDTSPCFMAIVEDITERKRAEALRARLAAVVESSNDAILSKSLDGIIDTWNASAERMFGYTAEEVVGRPVTVLFPEERLHEEQEILARLRRGERIEHFETVRRRRDGTLIDVSLTASPVRDSSGAIIGVSKITRNISERKRLDAALRAQTRVLELLNETGLAIAANLELPALVQSVTDKATELSGASFGAFFYNAIDAHGESYVLFSLSGASRETFDAFGLPRNTPLFEATFRGQGIVRLDDVTQDPRYGRNPPHRGMPAGHLPVRSYLAVPVVSRSGAVIGGLFFGHPEVGVFTEHTERIVAGVAAQAAIAIDNARLYEDVRRAAEERASLLEAERAARSALERTSQMKDEFLATLSHELRTPLTSILGWTQLLRAGQGPGVDLQHGMEVIERNTRSLAQLIADLLDMSRIVSGKLSVEFERVQLGEVVGAAVAAIRPAAESKGIRLETTLRPDTPQVHGDANRLQQCVWNLLTNAVKFTPPGGKVQVELAPAAGRVEIAVRDDGEGIDPEFLPYLFERFRQSDASSTRRHGGLGLGLSIVRSLVELHGGRVSASSPGRGHGATFRIELPTPATVPAVERDANGRRAPHGIGPDGADRTLLKDLRVLVVDDDPDTREVVSRVLEECGARVFLAASATEGLAVVERRELDMIVSDIGMPRQDGYDFIRQVRRREGHGERVPAAALTAFARAEDRTRALRAGYQIHVAKPVDPAELTAVIASLARRR